MACRPRARRFRINGRIPVPASRRARELGSGVVMDPVKVPVNEHVVVLVDVQVPVLVDWPVSPAKIPVPPVNILLTVLVEVLPANVPFPEKVPNRLPPAKVSTKVPLVVNAVVLEKVNLAMFVTVKAPNPMSVPEPLKLPINTAGSPVGVEVIIPVRVPDIGIVSAWAGTARLAITTRANKVAASERIIAKPPMPTPPGVFGFIRKITANLALLKRSDLSRQAVQTPQINADFEQCIAWAGQIRSASRWQPHPPNRWAHARTISAARLGINKFKQSPSKRACIE